MGDGLVASPLGNSYMTPLMKILTREQEELNFKAKMTQIQFTSLAKRLNKPALLREMASLRNFTEFEKSPTCVMSEVKKWLINGWNTEYLLRINALKLEEDALRNSLQWAFPQAYYSVFTICLAFFKVAGFTELSHNAVMSKVGKLMAEAKYPLSISFLANGGKERIYLNITKNDLPSTIHFNDTPEVIDSQICQFLNSTREMELEEKKQKFKLTTKGGKRKTHYSEADWEAVSKSIGFTSVINLLYRKRIKSNYRDIETYLCEELDPDIVYRDLIRITSSINLVHEAFIVNALGELEFSSFYKKLCPEIIDVVSNRQKNIAKIIA